MAAHVKNGNGEKAVGVWIRVSTDDQVRGESPEIHEKRARMYAEARGWKVREVYRLEAVSGKAVMHHAEAQRMLSDLRSGHIAGLIFSKLARLARNTKELLEFADVFREMNADMVSLAEAIDTSSPAGRLFFTIVAAMAQWEREEIADRVAASVPVRAKLGRPLGGAAPFGYRWQDKKLVLDENEGPVRALMYELFSEHKRKKVVARILNERGYRTRNGSKFTDTTIDRLLRDPTAKGVYRQNYTRTSDRSKAWELKPENEWVLTPVEAVVDQALWESCNRFLSDQRGKLRRVAKENVYLFTGYAYCACGSKMYVWKQSPKYICPKCRNKIPMTDLEAIFRDQLAAFVVSPEALRAHAEAANEQVREAEGLIAAAGAELERVEGEAERLYRLYMNDGISQEDFTRKHRPLSEGRKQLEDELPRLQAKRDVLKVSALSEAVVRQDAVDLATVWDRLQAPEKRHLVETITDKIVVGREDVAVNLLYVAGQMEKQRCHVAAGI